MAYPMLKEQHTWFDTTKASRPDFKIIRIVDSYEPTGGETDSWKADVEDTGNIMCYVVGSEPGNKELIIAGNGSGMISANYDSTNMFRSESISTTDYPTFKNVTNFYGAELLDMSNVKTLKAAFAYFLSLEYINVSEWDMSNVESIEYIFGTAGVIGETAIKHLDPSKWDVSKVTTMKNAFLCCRSIKHLDLSKWDVSNVVSFNSAFRGCSALQSVSVENWDVSAAIDMTAMFSGCSSLSRLDVSRWDNSNVTSANMNNAFSKMDSLEVIKIGRKFKFGDGYPYIEDENGALLDTKWHTLRGDIYTPKNMPSNVSVTFYASPLLVVKVLETPVMISGETALDIANAIREKTGTVDDIKPSEIASMIRGII